MLQEKGDENKIKLFSKVQKQKNKIKNTKQWQNIRKTALMKYQIY